MTGINDEAFNPDNGGSPDFNLKSRDVICEFIESTNTPFTIGIKGSWGSGKTSLLQMIKGELDKTKGKIKFHQIWVNAWEHSIFKETKDTVTSLAYQISSEIEFKAYGKKRKVSEAGKLIGNFLSMGANAGAAFISKGEVTNFSKWWKSSRNKDDIQESDFFLPVNSLKKKVEQNVKKINQINDCKIVVYIDDLDRMHPEEAVKLLELLKNLFHIEHFVFVLAIDYEVIKEGLKAKFGEKDKSNERQYRQFFDKIIQLPFTLPENEAIQTKKYLSKQLEKIDFLDKEDNQDFYYRILDKTVSSNPRTIKRIANYLNLFKTLKKDEESAASQHFKEDYAQESLFAIYCIQVSHSMGWVYNYLNDSPDFTKWLYDVYVPADKKHTLNIDEIKKELKDITKIKEYAYLFNDEWEKEIYKIGKFNGNSFEEICAISEVLNIMKETFTTDVIEEANLIKSAIECTNFTSGNIMSKEINSKSGELTEIQERRYLYWKEFWDKLKKVNRIQNITVDFDKSVRKNRLWKSSIPVPSGAVVTNDIYRIWCDVKYDGNKANKNNSIAVDIGIIGKEKTDIEKVNNLLNKNQLKINEKIKGEFSDFSGVNPNHRCKKIYYVGISKSIDAKKPSSEETEKHVKMWIIMTSKIIPYIVGILKGLDN